MVSQQPIPLCWHDWTADLTWVHSSIHVSKLYFSLDLLPGPIVVFLVDRKVILSVAQAKAFDTFLSNVISNPSLNIVNSTIKINIPTVFISHYPPGPRHCILLIYPPASNFSLSPHSRQKNMSDGVTPLFTDLQKLLVSLKVQTL